MFDDIVQLFYPEGYLFVKLTAKVKLQTNPEQHQALLETLYAANAACDYMSTVAWETRTFSQFRLHKLVYQDVRKATDLTAQMVVRCISKVADGYKLDKKTRREFNRLGSIAYDDRILRWYVNRQTVSIWTFRGRMTIPFVAGQRQLELLKHQRGESDLVFIEGTFYLFATCEKETPEPQDVEEFLGVDLGIKNIAADSRGETYAGNHLNSLRKRHAKLRKKLQSKGTQQARRLLKKRRRKESRMASQKNHEIAKRIVEKAQRHSLGIALEDLKGLRDRVTVKKGQRSQHSSWAFYDLRQKIEYKAQLAGVPVIAVDPRNTSRTCPVCSCADKRNRPNQATFLCVSCGHFAPADTNAAVNIGRRAAVNQPYIPTTSAIGNPKRDIGAAVSGKSPQAFSQG
jgi:IS605 OrfB family transposase